ncbi:MAG: hypothetical protein WC477_07085 [Patescibacteria group bacterium]
MAVYSTPSIVTDLSIVRETLRIPTRVAAMLARKTGAELCLIRPGCIEAILARSSMNICIKVRPVNIYLDEAMAYRLAQLPVPDSVLEDSARWERETNGQ